MQSIKPWENVSDGEQTSNIEHDVPQGSPVSSHMFCNKYIINIFQIYLSAQWYELFKPANWTTATFRIKQTQNWTTILLIFISLELIIVLFYVLCMPALPQISVCTDRCVCTLYCHRYNRNEVYFLVCTAVKGFTSLCTSEASLACSVSRVSGRVEYRELDTSFFPFLYFIWKWLDEIMLLIL